MKKAKENFVHNTNNIRRITIALLFFVATSFVAHANPYWLGSVIGKEKEITDIFYSPAGIVLLVLMFGFFAYMITRFFFHGVFAAKQIRKQIKERLEALAVKDPRLELHKTEIEVDDIILKYFKAIDEGEWDQVRIHMDDIFFQEEKKNERKKDDHVRFVSLRYATPSGLEYAIRDEVLYLSLEVFAGVFMKNTDDKMISGQRARMYQEHYYFFTLTFTETGWKMTGKSEYGKRKIYSEDENKTVLQKIPSLQFPLAGSF